MLTIRHYKIFKAVAECANMSVAAKHLYLSQPTVSQTIQEVEGYYGEKLFERFPKKLYITEAGKRLLSYVNPLLSAYDNISLLSLVDTPQYALKVGATNTVSSCILTDILKRARRKNSNLDISVRIDNTGNIEELLLKNEFDFALVEGVIQNRDIITVPIADDCLVLVCGKTHPFAGRFRVPLHELNEQAFILREAGSGTRRMFEARMLEHQINYKVKWECTSFDSIKAAIMADEGIGVISARLIEKELNSGELCLVNASECIWPRDFFLCYHKNKTLNAEMQAFMETCMEYKVKGVKCPIVSASEGLPESDGS